MLPTLSDLKTYLGITGTQDDTLLATMLVDALGQAETDTGRTFASGSNSVTRYSTEGQVSLIIHDRPYVDPSRTVTLNGVSLTEGTSVWFLPDRRDPNITATVQLRPFSDRPDAYKTDPMWWDKNLDRDWTPGASPNDLVISGIIGHPFPRSDISAGVKLLGAWLYWRAKGGASGFVQLPGGEELDLSVEPEPYARFVRKWSIRTAVASGG